MAKGKVKVPRGAIKSSERSSYGSDLDDYFPEALFYNDEEKIFALLVSYGKDYSFLISGIITNCFSLRKISLPGTCNFIIFLHLRYIFSC